MGLCILLAWFDGYMLFLPPASLNLDYGDSVRECFKERGNGIMEFAHCQLPLDNQSRWPQPRSLGSGQRPA
jgi:hypothetical protein